MRGFGESFETVPNQWWCWCMLQLHFIQPTLYLSHPLLTQENERACCVVRVQWYSNQTWRTESMRHRWLDIAILCNSMWCKFQGAWAGFRHIPRELLGALRAGPWLCCVANIEIMRFPKSLTSTPARDWHEHSLSFQMYVKVTLGECGNVAFQHLRVPMLSKYTLQAQGKKQYCFSWFRFYTVLQRRDCITSCDRAMISERIHIPSWGKLDLALVKLHRTKNLWNFFGDKLAIHGQPSYFKRCK